MIYPSTEKLTELIQQMWREVPEFHAGPEDVTPEDVARAAAAWLLPRLTMLPTHAEVDAYFWEQFRVKGDGTYSDAIWATLLKFGPRFVGAH